MLQNFSIAHIKEILEADRCGINMYDYIDSRYSSDQLKQIKLGLLYLKTIKYNEKEYEKASKLVSLYCNPEYNAEQMAFILKGIQQIPDKVECYINPTFSYPQMLEIHTGIQQKLKVSIYADPIFDAKQMRQIRLGLLSDFDVSIYADPCLSWQQMKVKRLQLIEDSNALSSPELMLINDTLQTMQDQINQLTTAIIAMQKAIGCEITLSESAEDDEE